MEMIMKNEMYDYQQNCASQIDFAHRYRQSQYHKDDWVEYREYEQNTIKCIIRWLAKINEQQIYISRLHIIHPRFNTSPEYDDVMFVIEFASQRTSHIDDLFENDWRYDDDFQNGINDPECPANIFAAGIDCYKLIICPTY